MPEKAGAASGASAGLVEARKLAGASGPDQRLDGFTYTVLLEPEETRASGERRRSARRRSRLRSGKIVDGNGRFITECLFYDLSVEGSRLRLPPDVALPATMQVYDDATGLLHEVTVRWRRERNVGVTLRPAAATARSKLIAEDMRRKFYAVAR